MVWIYKNKDGYLIFSKSKPEKLYIFRFRNDEIHSESSDLYYFFREPDYVIEKQIHESYFDNQGYYELFDSRNDYLLKKVYKEDCVFEGDYSMGLSIKLKPKTIATLKSIVDLENLTIEDGLIEI